MPAFGVWDRRPKVLRVLQVPTVAELQVQTALPNDTFPSDHLALGADIALSL